MYSVKMDYRPHAWRKTIKTWGQRIDIYLNAEVKDYEEERFWRTSVQTRKYRVTGEPGYQYKSIKKNNRLSALRDLRSFEHYGIGAHRSKVDCNIWRYSKVLHAALFFAPRYWLAFNWLIAPRYHPFQAEAILGFYNPYVDRYSSNDYARKWRTRFRYLNTSYPYREVQYDDYVYRVASLRYIG